MSVIANERTKLLANALDRASTACFTVGVATPLAAYVYDFNNVQATLPYLKLVVGVAGWIVTSVGLHLAARRVLGSLNP